MAVPSSIVYARPQVVAEADIELMRQIDERYLKWTFFCNRPLREELQQREGTGSIGNAFNV